MVNRENLKMLSDGLLGLIPTVISTNNVLFSMSGYSIIDQRINDEGCNTICCAVGWSPYFGIEKLVDENYISYCDRVFGVDIDTWNWLFSSSWADTDNTKRGAGLRIKYFLEHGLPENWKNLMHGYDPLTYLEDE